MKDESAINWLNVLQILLAIGAGGVGYIVNHQVTIVAYLAIGIVWLLTWLGRTFPKLAWIQGKAVLTGLVFVVAFGLSLVLQPMGMPAFPTWTGDLGTYAPLLGAFLPLFFAALQSQVLFAMTVYNTLLASVLEKASNGLTTRLA